MGAKHGRPPSPTSSRPPINHPPPTAPVPARSTVDPRTAAPPPNPIAKLFAEPAPPPPPPQLHGRLEDMQGYQPSHVYQLTGSSSLAFPDAVILDKQATSIRCGYGALAQVPNFDQHTRLTELWLPYNCLRGVGTLPVSLTRLDLSNNQHIRTFSISICTLVNLKELSLSMIGLESIPDEIRNCVQLEELRLDHNQLSSIPAAIGALGSLKWLYLSNNHLSALPGTIVQLHVLETFDIERNRGWLGRKLGRTPDEIMKRLGEMDLLTGVEYVADLKAMINNRTFSDVRIVVGDSTLDVHRFMLRRCPAFCAFLANVSLPRATSETPDGSAPLRATTAAVASPSPTPIELELQEDFDELSYLVEYLYTHRLPRAVFSTERSATSFAVLAERYQLRELAEWVRSSDRQVMEDDPLFSADLRFLLTRPDSDSDLEMRFSDGTAMRCHRAMLAARSDYWLCLFNSGLAESRQRVIAAPADIAPSVMRVVLAWLYSSDRELLNGDNAVELLMAADRLRVETLRAAAQAYLLSGLELDNAPYMWALARTHRAKHLEVASADLMRASSLKVLRQCSTWEQLTMEEVRIVRELISPS